MKKICSIMLVLVTTLSLMVTVQAKVGDVIGIAYNTDIVAYINHYAIPSYAVNGTSVVVAEELRNFGFDVAWNDSERTLSITRNSNTRPNEMSVSKTGAPSTAYANLLETDIKVYANGTLIPSYAINGYTMVPLEALTMFGTYNWVSEQRALKLWIDNLHVRDAMQSVTKYEHPADTHFDKRIMREGMVYTQSYIRHYSPLGFSMEYISSFNRTETENSVTLHGGYNEIYMTITRHAGLDTASAKSAILNGETVLETDTVEINGQMLERVKCSATGNYGYQIKEIIFFENNGLTYSANLNYPIEATEGIAPSFYETLRSIDFN